MTNMFAPGTVVDSRYVLIELPGEGGNGFVYKARELELDRIIAIKFLHSGLVGDSENFSRFKREGKVLAELQHPNILRCYRFGVWKECIPYIAMELLIGSSLKKLCPLPAMRAIEIARQVCSAMHEAHSRNIIHRDLTPGNIIIDSESNDAKVLDFGLARVLPTEESPNSQHVTQTGTLLGSVFYMSPEQCTGKKADVRSDVYSLGCVLYEMVTGEPPSNSGQR